MGIADAPEGGERDKEYRLRHLYLAIVMRYKAHIEEHESLSIAELPSLVTVKNEKVMAKVQEIAVWLRHIQLRYRFLQRQQASI